MKDVMGIGDAYGIDGIGDFSFPSPFVNPIDVARKLFGGGSSAPPAPSSTKPIDRAIDHAFNKVQSPATHAAKSALPYVLGAAAIAGVVFVVMRKKKKGGRR